MSTPTLLSLDTRVTALENNLSNMIGKYYPISTKLDSTNSVIYVRTFDSITNFFKLDVAQLYTCHILLENFGGSGQINADITIEIKYSTSNSTANLNDTKILQGTRKDIVITPNQTSIVNFTPFTIPAEAVYIEVYISVTQLAVNTPGITTVSLNIFKPNPPTQLFVNQ